MVIYHTMFIPTFCFSRDIQIFFYFHLNIFSLLVFFSEARKTQSFLDHRKQKEKDNSEDTGYQRETTPTQDLTVNRIHTKFLFS